MLRSINKIQILIGALGLLLGSLVYLVDRPPAQTYFVSSSTLSISLYNILPNLFGSMGNSLPAFIHVFSFIVITAGLVSYQKKGYLIICICWFLVDCVFELGQKFTALSSKMIPDFFIGVPFLENTEGFFLQGTFDVIDLAAITLGSIIAYFVLLASNKRSAMS